MKSFTDSLHQIALGVTGLSLFTSSRVYSFRQIALGDRPTGGPQAQFGTSGSVVANSTIGISVVFVITLLLTVTFLLKRKGSRNSKVVHEMDDEREASNSNGNDAIGTRECEVSALNHIYVMSDR
jgi:hypothetical protein